MASHPVPLITGEPHDAGSWVMVVMGVAETVGLGDGSRPAPVEDVGVGVGRTAPALGVGVEDVGATWCASTPATIPGPATAVR